MSAAQCWRFDCDDCLEPGCAVYISTPNTEILAAVEYAEQQGWLVDIGTHGTLCPFHKENSHEIGKYVQIS